MSFNNKVINTVDFLILEEGEPILSTNTITKLEILKIEPKMNNLAEDDFMVKILNWYKSLFKGMCKRKDFQLKIPVDSSVEFVCQAARRVHIICVILS